MNEFIVWDKGLNCFHSNGRVKLENGVLKPIGQDYTIHKGVGLKDINGKSIYAYSSIVEFDYLIDIENEIFKKIVGIFYFEKTFLAYHISFLTGINRKGGNADKYNAFGMKNFKIIDTIQENKLGLIK